MFAKFIRADVITSGDQKNLKFNGNECFPNLETAKFYGVIIDPRVLKKLCDNFSYNWLMTFYRSLA